jgi:hypothetical protein
MEYKSFCTLCCCLLLIVLILSIVIIFQLKKQKDDEYYEFTTDKLVSGTLATAKDLKNYSSEKWIQLKKFLKKHYKEMLIRKLFKFLNNSNLQYLGKVQDPTINPEIKLKYRKTVTDLDEPTLLQSFCTRVKNNKEQSKKWLLLLLQNNIHDYLYEQWKLKSTLYRAILSLGENYGFLTGEEILQKYINEIIHEEYDLIIDHLMKFVNYEGINVCSGKKQSKIGSFIKNIFN